MRDDREIAAMFAVLPQKVFTSSLVGGGHHGHSNRWADGGPDRRQVAVQGEAGRSEAEPEEGAGRAAQEGEEDVMVVAGCYARKSTDEGDKAADAKSVARQVQRAKEYVAKKGWRFDDDLVFSDDGMSGAEFRTRAGLNRLLETVKGKHKLNVLIVSEQSRLGRDTIRTLALIQALTDADVRIFSYLEDKEISVDDEMAEIEQFMKSWAGASERRKASQRVRDKMRQLAEQGRSTGGRLYGYETKGGQRIVKPSEAGGGRRIFKRRAEGAGYFKIARELERDEVASPRGARSWSPTQVGSILSNATYSGVSVWGGTRQVRRRGPRVRGKPPESAAGP